MKNDVMLFLERNPMRSFETEEIYLNRIVEVAVSESLDLADFFLVLNNKYPQRWKQLEELNNKFSGEA
ncbi:hypothetical protein JKP22_09865 [Vibrio vulnificus]|uniref:hypothetical protein n=1 Tax=Vibrio vulnificus TaxID=672 RepID=UPI001CDD6643|nr:hypothetical protein [Vibrio vulnificus]MCA4013091.1 hypothetical protein [Vibrio vulnificus]MCU8515363.1 hypothetical protein [Vibrio vulnificus]HAU8296166.1 hypothetical protein [Vibrio vulnificus]HDY7461744.1 hypothetical protein [Vibrio vulnificus]HDY7696861.1 hypothetical protein [Vibrio vulnificus]